MNTQIWLRDLPELQHMRPQRKQHRSPRNETKVRERQSVGWDCVGLVTAWKAERGHESDFPQSEKGLNTKHETEAQEEHASNEDADASTKM